MKKKGIILYSSSLAMILSALLAWLMVYAQNPQKADVAELQEIVKDFEQVKTEMNTNKTPPTNTVPLPVSATTTVILNDNITLMAWWFPGPPACNALVDAKALSIDVAKPEYFRVQEDGVLQLMTESLYGCNGYSKEAITNVHKVAKQQYVTVSSISADSMNNFLLRDATTNEYTNQLVKFVIDNQFTGVEIDFEDYGGWSKDITKRYMQFLTRLGNGLHANNKKLMIDLPPATDTIEEKWYNFRLSDINNLPVDYIVIMGYDYQYDQGAGKPVAPLNWLIKVVEFTKSRITNTEKIVIGLPTYGYKGNTANNQISILTYNEAVKNPLFSKLIRDKSSGELMAINGSNVLIVQDQESINQKVNTILKTGINKISIWHLGGNPLPSL